MKSTQHPDASTRKLLDRLEQKQDSQVSVIAVTGRALSRSANNVHLAVAGGIVAVPIANIEKVVSVNASQPNVVRVVVRNPRDIQPLLGVRPAGPPWGGSGGPGTIEESRDGEKVYNGISYQVYQGVATVTYLQTETITGGQGQADQSDDEEEGASHADDEAG